MKLERSALGALLLVCGLLLASVVLGGCTSGATVQRGIDLYQAGNDEAAMKQFRDIESNESSFNPKGLTRYYVYRGLTAYDLGNREEAKLYLAKGKAYCQRGDTRWIAPNIRDRVDAALKDLGE
jgi:hypothetical protein